MALNDKKLDVFRRDAIDKKHASNDYAIEKCIVRFKNGVELEVLNPIFHVQKIAGKKYASIMGEIED